MCNIQSIKASSHIHRKPHPTFHRLRPGTLIHVDRIDQPIRVPENARIILHIRLTRRRLAPTARLRPDILIASPVPAERGVEDDLHVLEMAGNVAMSRSAAEVAHRRTPFAWIGRAGRDVGGDLCAWEEPDGDGLVGPFGGVDAAACGVEAGTV